ncbi:MAG: hypothetical protein HDR05_08220 [Lachnospiraceae bacterium]|nr:hypothetical protein [Lachnospiraceae bacterium]
MKKITEKYAIRWIVWLASMAFAVFICMTLGGMRQEAAEVLSFVGEKAEAEEKGLQIFVYSSDEYESRYALTPWFSKKDDKYFLFLPDWAFEISFSKDILFDGKTFAKGQKMTTEKTQFSFVCEEREYSVEIVQLAQISTLYMDTSTGSLAYIGQSKENKDVVEICAVDEQGKMTGQAFGKINCRGNVTFEAPKKSYTLELAEDTDLYGMGEAKKWILLANSFDSTSIRNYLSFYMAKQMNMYGTPEARWVDVFANGEYQGIYLLCEKIEVDKERLDINDLEVQLEENNNLEAVKKSNFYMISSDGQKVIQKGFRLEYEPEDISGGYLLELESVPERYEEEKSGFISDGGQQVVIKSPAYASPSQVKYISGLYQTMEDALLQAGNTVTEDAFLEYADLESFTKKYLIEEVSKNMDASASSLYLYKPEDDISTKLYAGPVWDYDRAYGNMGKLDDNLDLRTPDGMYVQDGWYGTGFWSPFCWNPYFQESVKKIYEEEMLPVIEECVNEKILQWEELIMPSAYADLMRWPDREEEVKEFQNLSYEEKVDRLINFLDARSLYLKEVWGV